MAVSNISGFLERNLASRLSAGAVSILAYAMRLFTVPASFFAAPLAIVAYPQFAHEAARGEKGELPNKISRVIRLVWFVFLPVTVLLMLNALPITRFVYEHGRFSPADSFITARALALYGTGILPNALAIVLLRCFFAIQDTVTPLWAEVVNLGFYAVAAVVMARHFGIAGLALARGAGFFPFAAILVFVLWKRRGLLRLDLDFLNFLWRSVTAAIVLALVNWISMRLFQKWFDGGNAPVRLGIIFGVLLLAGTAFLIVARLLRLDEASQIMSAVRDLMAVRGDRSALISPPEV